MARTPSSMVELNSKAPEFRLLDTIDNKHKTDHELFGTKATVVMFICNHCPFVIHVNPMLVKLAHEFPNQGVRWIAISSNDALQYTQDGPDKMKIQAQKEGYVFPYLYDKTQEVAKAYDATCTPDFFVYDSNRLLVYRGQLDDSRPQNGIPLTGNDLRNAIKALLNNQPITTIQKPSIGCNIKWKKA